MANFTIKPFQNPSGATVYRVSGFIGKRRIRENHGDETTALQAKQNHEREAANLPALPLVTTRLTECQAAEAEAAFHRLNGSPLTLSQAVEFALKNFAPSARTITVQKAFDEFMLSKKRENCRPATLRNLRDRLQPLAKAQPESLLNEITTATLEPFIFGHGSPINQRNNHLVLSNFFNWAKRNKYVAVSPLESVGYVKLERREVEILTVAQCRAVVRAARDHKGGKFLPFVTLALFCGIRPTEISRLTWDNINLQNELVTIGGNARERGGIPFDARHKKNPSCWPRVAQAWTRQNQITRRAQSMASRCLAAYGHHPPLRPTCSRGQNGGMGWQFARDYSPAL
jgi:integrase